MRTEIREVLKDTWIEVPIRHSLRNAKHKYSFRADELIDTIELALIKSPEFRKELKEIIEEIMI